MWRKYSKGRNLPPIFNRFYKSSIYNNMKKLLALLLIFLATCFYLKACGGLKEGDKVIVRRECLACDDLETLNLSVKYANEHNQVAFNSLVRQINTTILKKGWRVTITQIKDDRVQVELYGDSRYGSRKVWVLERNIKEAK